MTSSQHVVQLLRRYSRARTGDGRQAAICRLIKEDPAALMRFCRDDVKASTRRERYRAAWVMAELGYPATPYRRERIRLLSELLRSDRSPGVRARAAQSLGMIGTESAMRSLLPALHDPDPGVRAMVAGHAHKSGGKRVLRCLGRLGRDKSALVREWAAFSLGLYKGRLDAPTKRLLLALSEDRAPRVRYEAIRARISRGDLGAVMGLVRELDGLDVPHELVGAVQELSFVAEGLIGVTDRG